MSSAQPAWHTHEVAGCDVIIADFAWFSSRCGTATNLRIRDEEGVVRALCTEHAKAAGLGDFA